MPITFITLNIAIIIISPNAHTALLLKAKVLAWDQDQDLNAKVALCCLYTVINVPQLAHVYAVVNHISYLICALTANVC